MPVGDPLATGAGDKPVSTVQFIKPEPASGDQRVPSQSKTAMRGARAWTAERNSGVERVERAGYSRHGFKSRY